MGRRDFQYKRSVHSHGEIPSLRHSLKNILYMLNSAKTRILIIVEPSCVSSKAARLRAALEKCTTAFVWVSSLLQHFWRFQFQEHLNHLFQERKLPNDLQSTPALHSLGPRQASAPSRMDSSSPGPSLLLRLPPVILGKCQRACLTSA